MKILLINAPSSYKVLLISSLAYLSAVLEKEGYKDIKIVDPYGKTDEDIREIIKKEKPDIVGASCMSNDRETVVNFVKIAKKVNKTILTVLGGVHPTIMYKQMMEHYPWIDTIVVGEGEITFLELVKAVENKSSFRKVNGLVYREGKKIVINPPRELIKNLDEVPFPAWHFFDIPKKQKDFTILTSRGCPNSCQFCSVSQFWGATWRPRSPKNVVDEVEMLVKDYGARYFNFDDANFTVDVNRVIGICKEIVKRKLKIRWAVQGHVNTMNEEMLKWMKKAGCVRLSFGVESGSPKVLKTISKVITPERAIKAYKMVHKYGIKAAGTFMVGNPGDNEETINETIRLMDKIDIVGPDTISTSLTTVYPGTALYQLSKQKGLLTDDYWLSDKTAPIYTAEHSLEELDAYQAKIQMFFLKKMGLRNYMRFFFDWLFPKGYDNKRSKPRIKRLVQIVNGVVKHNIAKLFIGVENENN